jgi:hypothetical protein
MTGSADDGPGGQPHIRSKAARRQLAHRFKDSAAPFQIEIVRDIWRTGFEALCLHTMDADEPMQGHSLMQVFAVMLETHGIAAELPHGFGWSAAICSSPRCGASSTGTWPPSGSKGS